MPAKGHYSHAMPYTNTRVNARTQLEHKYMTIFYKHNLT